MKLRLDRRKQPPEPTRARPESPAGSRVFSYYATGSREANPRSQQAEKRNQPIKTRFGWQGIPSIIATVLIIGSVLYVLSLETNPRIQILSGLQQATLLQKTEVYQAAAQDILSSSVLNRTKLTINTDAVARELKNRYPELSDVAITVPLASHRLLFELEPVEPSLILVSDNGSHVVDQNGRAVVATKNVPALSKLSLPQVTDSSSLQIEPGTAALPKEHVEFIIQLMHQLEGQKLNIETLTLPTVPNELHVRVAGDKYFVKFNMQGSARLQAGAYSAMRKQLSAGGIKPKEYVDVRVEERAFYK